ncbi:CinA family protein [Spiroplasma endosymbiont of Polydrusus pterygomalis]|uniref:CinA family protein n=1 Tax=Spiroplasma endosymbiont of Polydrusus pterygomalis TaxID=3139327 RepID=UPI003CCAE9E3
MNQLLVLLNNLNFTIGCCESITGGLFAQEITSIAGASKYFSGGFITYTNETKINVVKVKKITIERYGTISKECAIEMALNTQKILKTNIAISFTGNAGPSVIETKPIGLIYIGIVINNNVWCEVLNISGNRREIRAIAVDQAISILKKSLLKF